MSHRLSRLILLGMLSIHACMLGYIGAKNSPTLNEPAHLVAGISHWKFSRFELYRVNPPLVRMVAALPVMAAGYEENWNGFNENPGARPVFYMDQAFISLNGRRFEWLLTWARWACIPFSLLGGWIVFRWAADLSGDVAGLVAAALWCFSPNILGHGSLITADAHATALGIAACYTFWRWLKRPSWTQALLTGVVLGLAELAKTTLVLFYPIWPLIWIAYRWPDRAAMAWKNWLREGSMLILRMLVGLYVLNLGYGFEGSFQRLGNYSFVSNLFTDEQTDHDSQYQVGNRFADTFLGELPIPVPKNYLLGIDIQQRDFENFHSRSYLRGEFRDRGWWYYYLYAATIKVPIGTWILGGLALAALMVKTSFARKPTLGVSQHQSVPPRDQLILLMVPVVVFAVVSSKTGFSHHFRYVLPCLPFLYVWSAALSVKRWGPFFLGKLAIACPLIWMTASSFICFPHSLSYFNEFAGGPLGGPRHLLHSNIDWGQDLYYLRDWMKEHPEAGPMHLAYYGVYNPAIAGLGDTLSIDGVKEHTGRGRADAVASDSSIPQGWYAVSVNALYGVDRPPMSGSSSNSKIPEHWRNELLQRQPDSYAGASIYIYQIKGYNAAVEMRHSISDD